MTNSPENQSKDYVKDIDSHKDLSQLDISVVNHYVEAEFRDFIKDKDINDDNRDSLQKDFNTKIDGIVDKAKETAIYNAIIELNFELTDLVTKITLWSLHAQIFNWTPEYSESSFDILFKSKDIQNIRIHNQDQIQWDALSAREDITWSIQAIAQKNPIIWNEFISLLKQANKEYLPDSSLKESKNIREFQQKLLKEISKYKEDNQYPLSPWEERYLDDWKFWARTYKALNFLSQKIISQSWAAIDNTNREQAQVSSPNKPVSSSAEVILTGDTQTWNTTATWNIESQVSSLKEVTDEREKQKITNKEFDIKEFSRWKIQKDSNWNYYSTIKVDIPGNKDFWPIRFDNQWNLIEQKISTLNKWRKPLYFADDDSNGIYKNKIRFINVENQWMYLTKDTITWVSPLPDIEPIQYDYQATDFDLLEWNRVEHQFEDLSYDALDKQPKLKKIMEEIISSEDGENDISKRKFKINLSPDDGLARIILDIYSKDSTNSQAKRLQKKKWTISVDDIKKCFPDYDRKWWLDNEKRKIAMILNQWDQTDLVNFAYDAESYAEAYEDKMDKAYKFNEILQTLDSNDILKSLCDYNVDWQLSAVEWNTQLKQKFIADKWWKYPWWRKDFREYKQSRKEKNKWYKQSQEWVWDTATIFGPQLYGEIQRSIAVMDVKLLNESNTLKDYNNKYNLAEGTKLTWENIVIQNIISKIIRTSSNPALEQALSQVPANQWTKAKLLDMAKNYTWKDWQENNWNFQPLFAKAIQQLNWSSSVLSPDLFDSLVGVERLDTSANRYSMIEKELEAHFQKFPDQEFKFKSDWFTDTKHTFITWLMSVLDNLQITASPQFVNVTKSRDREKYRHKVENDFTKKLIGWWLTAINDQSVWLNLSTWKKGFSEDWKFQRERNTWAWVIYNPDQQKLSAIINIWWEAARQYNYDKVMVWRLDDIKSAKYLWASADVYAWARTDWADVDVWWIAKAEIDRKQNPKQAIEQMNRQYRDVSNWIFHLPPWADISNSTSLKNTLIYRLNKLKAGAKEPIKTFLKNNEWFFIWNIQNISDYFDKRWIFKMMQNMPQEFAWDKKRNAINNLMQVLQTWIVDSWRDYMYDQLHGKVSVTKIWVWIGIWARVWSDWVEFSVPFPTLSFDISTWRKNYVSSAAGKYMDQYIIADWATYWSWDNFEIKDNNISAYADYIKARYNILPDSDNNPFDVKVQDGKIVFSTDWVRPIAEVLNVRAKLDQKVLDNIRYSDDGSQLTIGDVWDLWIFTSSDGQWVRNFLVIWQKWTVDKNNQANTFILQPPHPPLDYQWNAWDIAPIQREAQWYKKLTKSEFSALLDQNIKAWSDTYANKIAIIKDKILKTTREVWWDLFINWLNNKHWLSEFPITWKLIFTEDNQWNIKVTKFDAPSDRLQIEYNLNLSPSAAQATALEKKITYWKPEYTEFKNLFSSDIDQLFNDEKMIVSLSKLDDKDIIKLDDFLYKAWNDIDKNWTINEKEYLAAADVLSLFLWDKYPDIKNILDWDNIQKKALVINRMKWIFATQEWVTNYTTLQTIVSARKDAYKQLSWPNKSKFPTLQGDYRKAILDQLSKQSDKTNLSQKVEDWLFGFTAFYRKWTNDWRWFSLTAPWATKVLWWATESFSSADQKAAKERFIQNLESNQVDLAIIAKSITAKVPGSKPVLTEQNAIDLLKWEPIDFWDKIIKLDSDLLFYLLWECANESIWVKIKWITITSKTPENIIPVVSWSIEKYSGEIVPEANYVWWLNISARNLSVPMVPWAYQHDVWVGLMWNIKERPAKDKTDPWIGP